MLHVHTLPWHNANGFPTPKQELDITLQVRTFACTDFTIVESSGESTLDTSHRPMHDATAELVQQIVQDEGFTLMW